MAPCGCGAVPHWQLLKLAVHNPCNWRIVAEKGGGVSFHHYFRLAVKTGARVKTSGEVIDGHSVVPFLGVNPLHI